MSTRATIKFTANQENFYIYRHCDGYPEQVVPDINSAIKQAKGRWSEPEVGLFVSFFLGIHFNPDKRLPDYELTSGWHGDESYRYEVRFDKEWKTMIIKSASLNSDDPFGYKKEIERMAKPPHCSNCWSNDLEVFDSFDWKCKECGDIFYARSEIIAIMREYQKYEFCKAVCCQYLADKCSISNCIYTAKDLHEWLKKQDFKIIKKKGDKYHSFMRDD